MRTQTAVIASVTSLALALPASAFASAHSAPEEDELVIEDDEPEDEPDDGPSEEEKMELARALYAEGKAEADKGNWEAAEAKYEEAYRLVPSKHGFAHKVGMAAYNAGNCDKTVEFLVHFIHYTDHEKHGDQIEESRSVLAEMLEKGCTTEKDIHFYHLGNEERSGMARDLYVEAEALAGEGKWKEAEALYEEAYILVPHKIGFSHKVGMAAYNAWTQSTEAGSPSQEDCDTAHEYLVHFVDFAKDDKYAQKRDESAKIITELEETCVSKAEMEVHQLEGPGEAIDEENPFAERSSQTETRTPQKTGKGGKGLLIGGVVLTIAGAGGLGVGAAGLVLAANTSTQLTELASLETTTGYPTADYEEAQPLEAQLDSRKLMGYLGLGIGGAVFVTGIALIAVHASKNKKKASSRARIEGVAPMLTRGGVGATTLVRF